jgi:outer membrane protein OmpA-like peptidoglycan-associated protein
MKPNDFIICTFTGDPKTKYVARISKVNTDSFDCRFVHSGKEYTFDSHSFSVLKTNGGFPKGTPLTSYKLFSLSSGTLFQFCYVVVTFADNNQYLGVLTTVSPERTVVFLHSGSTYRFSSSNEILSSTGAYKAGSSIKGMELYNAGTLVELAPLDISVDNTPPGLSKRMGAVKSIVPTGSGEVVYTAGSLLGSVMISNFDINSPTLKVEYHIGLDQLANAMNASAGAKALIIGRASQTGKEDWNLPLSERRADAVLEYLTSIGSVASSKFIDSIGAGSYFPLKDNKGIEEQINRSVQIFFHIPMVIPPPPPPPAPKPADIGSRNWAIKTDPTVTMGAAIAGTFLVGTIKNMTTGEEKSGFYIGGGLGISTPYMPKAGGVGGDWTSFTTDDYYTLDDFDGTLCRYTTIGAGFFIGYSVSYISFPNLGANSIDVGGFEIASFGAGGTTTVGVWKFS